MKDKNALGCQYLYFRMDLISWDMLNQSAIELKLRLVLYLQPRMN